MLRRLLVLALLCITFSTDRIFAQRNRVGGVPWPAGAPRVSPEFPLSEVVYGPAGGGAPRVAAGPAQALVAWWGGAVRVDAQGHPLDAVSLLQPEDGIDDVAWDGSRYAVATAKTGATTQSVQLTFVDTDGHVSAPLQVASTKYGLNAVAVAASGNVLLVAYTTGNFDAASNSIQGYVVKAALVSGGRVIGNLQLAAYADYQGIQVVASPTSFLVWWSGRYAIVTRDGGIVASNATYPEMDAVWNGSGWEGITALSSGVWMFAISRTGAMSLPVNVHSTLPAVAPAIAWNGSEYAILWQDEKIVTPSVGVYSTATYDLRAGRVSADQRLVAESLLVADLDFTDFRFKPHRASDAIAAVGARFVGVWGSGDQPVYAIALGTSLPTAAEVNSSQQLLSKAALSETISGIVANGESARLFFNNLETEAVDDRGRRGPSTPLPGINSGARFAFNGTDTFAASVASVPGGDSRIDGALVDQNGSIVRQFPITSLPTGTFAGPLSCNANDCATTWSDPVPAGTPATSHLQRISPAGTLIDAPVALPIGVLALSGRADQYLIAMAWGDRVFATRFADGKLSDVTDVFSSPGHFGGPAAAVAGPDGWLVAVIDWDMTNYGLHLAHLDTNAVRTWELKIVGDAPMLAWDGRNWIVVFTNNGDVYAARIAPDGTLLDGTPTSPGFPVAAQPGVEVRPFASSSGNGLTAVAYQRETNDRVYGRSMRAFVRWIDER